MRILHENDMCQFKGCDSIASVLVYSRKLQMVGKYCEKHCDIVEGEESPEYLSVCKNCGCINPVN
jgi:hypothetical protein